jgi:NADH dehydrogenase
VGTIEPRSLVEPIRKIVARVKGHFLNAKAVDIDMSERLIEVSVPGNAENFYVPYVPLSLKGRIVRQVNNNPIAMTSLSYLLELSRMIMAYLDSRTATS